MSQLISGICAVAVLSLATVGCGRYSAPIRSARDVDRASSSEYLIVLVSLPLEDWPKLQKFTALEHFRVAKVKAPEVTDNHTKALSRLKLPKLRQVSLAHCAI